DDDFDDDLTIPALEDMEHDDYSPDTKTAYGSLNNKSTNGAKESARSKTAIATTAQRSATPRSTARLPSAIAELAEIPALGTLLDEIDNPDLSELAGCSSSRTLNASQQAILASDVEVLANDQTIDKVLSDSQLWTERRASSRLQRVRSTPSPVNPPQAPH